MVRDWNDRKSGGPDPGDAFERRHPRPAWAEVDAVALRHNAATLAALVAPSTLCAVVKADGYGHGAKVVAGAATAAGAVGVAVALVEEGVRLRDAQFSDPVLLLSEPPPGSEPEVVELGLEPTVCSVGAVQRLLDAARALGRRVPVHVKVDTGMHRQGASPEEVAGVCELVAAGSPSLVAAGLWTHLAVADGASPDDRAFTAEQLRRFEDVRRRLSQRGLEPRMSHVANSAGAIAVPSARYQMARCGLALYGYPPSEWVREALERQAPGATLRPVLSLKARVSAVRELAAGERPSYGRLRPLPARSLVATVPLGYADGVARALFAGGAEVLIGGRRRPLAGMVTMDQIVVDCGEDAQVSVGDEVVLIGRQGAEEITADEWAARTGTISYEVLTAIGSRVPRRVVGAEPEDELEEDGPDESAGTRQRMGRWMQEARLR